MEEFQIVCSSVTNAPNGTIDQDLLLALSEDESSDDNFISNYFVATTTNDNVRCFDQSSGDFFKCSQPFSSTATHPVLTDIEIVDEPQVICWTDTKIKLLLDSVVEIKPKIGKTLKYSTETKMWREISRRFATFGFKITEKQLNYKFNFLKRSYKKNALRKKQSSRNRPSTNTFESEMDTVMRRTPTLDPESLVSSDDSTDDNSPWDCLERNWKNVINNSHFENTILTELIKMREAREKYMERKLAYLKAAEGYMRKKELLMEKMFKKI